MGKKPFDILAQPGQVNQLLNSQSIQTGGNGRKVTYLQDDYLVPLECNDDVYSVANLEALAKDIAQAGIRQPLIVFKNIEVRLRGRPGLRRPQGGLGSGREAEPDVYGIREAQARGDLQPL